MLVGVLALQGDFAEHVAMLTRMGVAAREVRLPRDLDGVDALIMPGGESTTFAKLAVRWGLIAPIRDFIAAGKPVWGTCAEGLRHVDLVFREDTDREVASLQKGLRTARLTPNRPQHQGRGK